MVVFSQKMGCRARTGGLYECSLRINIYVTYANLGFRVFLWCTKCRDCLKGVCATIADRFYGATWFSRRLDDLG